MQNDPLCPLGELKDEKKVAWCLEYRLQEVIAPMHAVQFARGFWTMFVRYMGTSHFISRLQELADAHYTTVQSLKLEMFQSFVNLCKILEEVPMPAAAPRPRIFEFLQHRVRRQAQSVDSRPIIICGMTVAYVRWRNQSGHMVVFEVIAPEDLDIM